MRQKKKSHDRFGEGQKSVLTSKRKIKIIDLPIKTENGSRKALSRRIRILERRVDYLKKKIADPRQKMSGKSYDKEECEALSLAVSAIQRYRAEYQMDESAIGFLMRAASLLETEGQKMDGALDLAEDIRLFLEEMGEFEG